MRLIAVIGGLLLSTIAQYAAAQIITIRVNRSTGEVCVATPGGVISSKFCEDGDDGTAGIPLLWASIGPFTNIVEGTTPCFDLRTYLTEPGTPDATLSLVGSVANWSLSTDDLCYDGSGVSSGTLIARATRDTVVSDSLSFAVSSVAAASTDTVAPSKVTGLSLALNGSDQPVITFDAPADVRVAGEDVSGVATFTVIRDATPLTPTALSGAGLGGPTYTGADVGTLSPAGTSVQDGADWSVSAEGQLTSVADEFRFVSTDITGDFTCTVRVDSFTNGEQAGRVAGLMMRETSGTLARNFHVRAFPSGSVRGNYRPVAEGAITQSGLITLASFPGWIQIERAGSTFTARAAQDGNDWGQVLSVDLGLNDSLKAGLVVWSAEDGVATTVEFGNFACQTLPRQTFTDTGASAGTTPGYTVVATDGAANASPASASESIEIPSGEEPPPPTSETPDYVDPVSGVTLLGGRTTVAAANSSALTAALPGSCGETIELSAATYTGTFTLSTSCAADNPVILKGAASFGSVVNGTVVMTGARNIVTGIDFNGANARVQVYGTNNKLVGNKIRNSNQSRLVMTGDTNGQSGQEIAYNEIIRSTAITTTPKFGIKADTTSDQNTVPLNVWVHHNYLHDFHDGSGVDTDPMEPGNSSHSWANTLMAGWYIEDNLFANYADCNQNVIDMKFSGTVIRRNTVSNSCTVKFSARIGAFYIFESNYMPGMQILTHGRGHKVVCNTGNIRVQAGQEAWDSTGKVGGVVPHNASFEVLVAGNNGSLTVGYEPNATYDLPALNTTIEDHTGGISFGLHDITNDNRNDPSSYNCAPAVELTTSDVGPAALSAAAAAYKAARGL